MKWFWSFVVVTVAALGVGFWFSWKPSPKLQLDLAQDSDPETGRRSPAAAAPGTPAPRQVVDRPVELPTQVKDDEQTVRKRIDPRNDGWDTEAAHEQISRRLKRLLAALEDPEAAPAWDKVRELATDDFQCPPLRPPKLARFEVDSWLEILLADPEHLQNLPLSHRGPSGLEQALRSLVQNWTKQDHPHGKFKVVRVKLQPPRIRTKVYFEFHARRDDVSLEQHATWWCTWYTPSRKQAPRLESIRLEHYQEGRGRLEQGVLLVDCTQDALRDCSEALEQFRFGLNHWTQLINRNYGLGITERFGLAVGDVNGDGRDDLFVCQSVGLPNRLLVQEETGRFVDRTREAGLDLLDPANSALLVDLDNDGDQDLVLACPFRVLWFANDGRGRFRLQFRYDTPTGDSHALSALDFDGDGDLDIYFTVGDGPDPEAPFVYFDATNGGANYLFRNDISSETGKWKFTDVIEQVGLTRDQNRHSLAAAWEDFDNDGDLDLYVANDYGPNTLYRNDGGRFVDITLEAGVEDPGSGMSVSWADFDHDGWMDLYVANMFSSAGNRITTQQEKLSQYDPKLLARIQRFAKGNSLFRNLDGRRFEEVSRFAGVEVARWAWASVFVDLNNDTWEDLVVANGYLTNEKPDDL